jgi:hypothetical protein
MEMMSLWFFLLSTEFPWFFLDCFGVVAPIAIHHRNAEYGRSGMLKRDGVGTRIG